MTVTTGMRLGRYLLRRRLGLGGMAEVWEAFDEDLQRTVAVKVILESVSREATFTERFIREARTVAGLEHPNILPIYDFGQQGETVYLVMPLVSGGSLRDRMHGPAPERAVCEWISGTAAALDHAHSMGVLHRDVKPANILMGKGDRPLLADFGLAKSASVSVAGLTATGAVMGTPTYMSPEQALGERLDVRSDQYALGVIAFQLLTGIVPFTADSPLVVLHKHLQEAPPPPSRVNPALPAGIDSVIARVLAKAPADRYPSCGAFAEALEAALQAEASTGTSTVILQPAATPPASVHTVAAKPAEATVLQMSADERRARTIFFLLGGFALLGVAAGAVWFWSIRRPPVSAGDARAAVTGVQPSAESSRPAPVPTRPLAAGAAAAAEAAATTAEPTATSSRESPAPTVGALSSSEPAFGLPQSREPTSEAVPMPTGSARVRPPPAPTRRKPSTVPTPPPISEHPAGGTASTDPWGSLVESGQESFRAGDYAGAEKIFRSAVTQAERFGPEDRRLANALDHLGKTYLAERQYPEAERVLERSLSIREKAFGPRHPETAAAANDLGNAEMGLKKYVRAEHLLRRALAIRTRVFAPGHPLVRATLSDLARLLEQTGRKAEADRVRDGQPLRQKNQSQD